jgi:hydroxymethylpyrimidine/phosphomethylpyrimidine kinase
VYGLTTVTCVVAEVPGKVTRIQAIDADVVREQIRLSFEAFPIRAVKTGMLYSREIISAVCDELEAQFAKTDRPPALVVDPVMVATSGDALLQDDAVSLYRERLIPMATVATPNLDEVQTLLGRKVTSEEEMKTAGRELVVKYGTAFLVKGGHLGGKEAVDLLVERSGAVREYRADFVRDVDTHGTGCTYAAAIASGLAQGRVLEEAILQAKEYVTRAVRENLQWTEGGLHTHALRHF